MFANHAKACVVLIGKKSCCQPSFLIRKAKDAKDVVASLTLGLKG